MVNGDIVRKQSVRKQTLEMTFQSTVTYIFIFDDRVYTNYESCVNKYGHIFLYLSHINGKCD